MRLEAEFRISRGELDLDIDLVAEPGQTTALLGPNGAGKSTVVDAIAGLLPIGSGRISVGGTVVDDGSKSIVAPEDRSVGIVFQDYLLFDHMTVADNVGFGLLSRGLGSDERNRRVEETMSRFGLDQLADRRAKNLSGGESQRVALARAVITDPDLLVLDEPTASLDATAKVEVRRRLMDDLADFDGPRILITHDPTEAFLMADVIYVLEDGQISQSGPAEEIRMQPRTRYVADLVGSNLIVGTASAGTVTVGSHSLEVGDTSVSGEVVASFHPRAVAVFTERPGGSPRNAWSTVVERIEHFGDRVRLLTGDPMPVAVEVTPGAMESLGLEVGTKVWLAVKATEIDVLQR